MFRSIVIAVFASSHGGGGGPAPPPPPAPRPGPPPPPRDLTDDLAQALAAAATNVAAVRA